MEIEEAIKEALQEEVELTPSRNTELFNEIYDNIKSKSEEIIIVQSRINEEEKYIAPEIEILEIAAEKGYAFSVHAKAGEWQSIEDEEWN